MDFKEELKKRLKKENIYNAYQLEKIQKIIEKTSNGCQEELWEYAVKLVNFRLDFKKKIGLPKEEKDYVSKQEQLKKTIDKKIINDINKICQKII